MNYVLITPARNEEKFIRKTLDAVTSQTLPPLRWVIVDDGSTDQTRAIAEEYASRFPWIEVVHRPEHIDRSFAGKVHAFNAGFERVKDLPYGVIGNLDSDISFDEGYMEFLMARFDEITKMGVGGTPFKEDSGYDSSRDSYEGKNYVAGGCQMFRRECYEEIGGYRPIRGGGIDWIAVTSARMKGWEVRSFQEKRFHHYRTLGTAETGQHGALYDYGKRAYSLGTSPVWQLVRCTYRLMKRPYITGAIALGWGYFWASIRRLPRPVDREMIRFCRREQMQKLRLILQNILRLKKVDNFTLSTEQKPTH